MEYKHVLKLGSTLKETKYEPTIILKEPLTKQEDAELTKIGAEVYSDFIFISKVAPSDVKYLMEHLKDKSYTTLFVEEDFPDLPIEQTKVKTLSSIDFSEIGVITRQKLGKDIPTLDQFMAVHIPALESIYVKPEKEENDKLINFVKNKKLVFYNSAPFEIAQTTLAKIFEIYPDLNIVDLSYRKTRDLDFGRMSGMPLPMNDTFQRTVMSYELFFDENNLRLVHKMNKKTYRIIRQLIGDLVPDYKTYVGTLPDVKPVDPVKYGLEEISLTLMDEVFVEKECKNKGVVLGKELSRGQYGVVHEAKMGDKDIVVKSELIRDKDISLNVVDRWKKEIMYQKRAAKKGIAADVLDHWVCPMMIEDKPEEESKVGFIAMEKIHGLSLEDYMDQNDLNEKEKGALEKKLRSLIFGLYSIDIQHNDLHTRNIMVEFNRDKSDYVVKALDFGDVDPFSKDLKRAHDQLKHSLNHEFVLGEPSDKDLKKFDERRENFIKAETSRISDKR